MTFDYRGWRVRIALDAVTPQGTALAHAELDDQVDYRCRLSLSSQRHDGASAMSALAEKARHLIDQRAEGPAVPVACDLAQRGRLPG